MTYCDSFNNVIEEDISIASSTEALWQVTSSKPEIKQIYGHFLPPIHMKRVNGIVAVDFNFPPAYHKPDSEIGVINASLDGQILIDSTTKVYINKSIRIRPEKDGAVVYTCYFNGFFINTIGYEIINYLSNGYPIAKVAKETKYDINLISNFVARLLALGIVQVV